MKSQEEKAWRYVGRFLWSFSGVADGIEQAFANKFNLDTFSSVIMQHHVDIRKKIELLKYAFKRQEISDLKTVTEKLGRVHYFHNIRNIIVHCRFEHVDSYTRTLKENGHKIHYPAGVEFYYVDPSGKLRLRQQTKGIKKQLEELKRLKKSNRQQIKDEEDLLEADEWVDSLLDETTITYAEFDEYHVEMFELMTAVFELDPEPVNEGSNFVRDVAEIIASSDNVLTFSKRPSKR
jgi:hypothetical protein